MLKRVTKDTNNERRFCLVGTKGAVDFWFGTYQPYSPAPFEPPRKYGGLEQHHRSPLYDKTEPDHNKCWLLDGPCWHDGSSMYASEVLIPLFEREGEEALWAQLHREYIEIFGDEE